MKWGLVFGSVLVIGLLVASVPDADAAAATPTYKSAVQKFCKSPRFKRLKCGFITPDSAEYNQTITRSETCVWCGTVYWGEMQPAPTRVSDPVTDGYGRLAGRVVSLACKGNLVIRMVYKIEKYEPTTIPNGPNRLEEQSFDAAAAHWQPSDGSANTPNIRCSLVLPKGYSNEVKAAVHSKEVGCKNFHRVPVGKGPGALMKIGKWYSGKKTICQRGRLAHAYIPRVYFPGGLSILTSNISQELTN